MPARRGRPPVSTPAEIRTVAFELFAAQGFDEVSIEDIADAAGVSRATVFRYFGSKAGIVWRDYEEMLTRITARLTNDPPRSTVMDEISAAIESVVHYGENQRRFVRIRNEVIESSPTLTADSAHIGARFANVISDHVRTRIGSRAHEVVPEAIGFAILGTVTTVGRLWGMSPPGTPFADVLHPALEAIGGPLHDMLGGRHTASPDSRTLGAPAPPTGSRRGEDPTG